MRWGARINKICIPNHSCHRHMEAYESRYPSLHTGMTQKANETRSFSTLGRNGRIQGSVDCTKSYGEETDWTDESCGTTYYAFAVSSCMGISAQECYFVGDHSCTVLVSSWQWKEISVRLFTLANIVTFHFWHPTLCMRKCTVWKWQQQQSMSRWARLSHSKWFSTTADKVNTSLTNIFFREQLHGWVASSSDKDFFF